MENLKFTIFALVFVLISIPIVMSVKKVSSYDTSINFRVTFDPYYCIECTYCPCNFKLNSGEVHKLNKIDKIKCTNDFEIVDDGYDRDAAEITVDFTVKEYSDFLDCLKWYSVHPTQHR